MFPVIQEILTEDVQEFVPYVFQILSLLLEYHNPGNITGKFNQEPHYFKKFEFSRQKKGVQFSPFEQKICYESLNKFNEKLILKIIVGNFE